MKYLLDANVFISAHRSTYPLDVFPSFWQWLESESYLDRIYTISEVYDEIEIGGDELSFWIKSLDKSLWVLDIDDERTQEHYSPVANWVMKDNKYKEKAINDFLEKADSWLIAKALADDYTIVTLEKSDPKSKSKVFIPDVCQVFNIKYTDTIGLMRELDIRL